MSLLRSNTYGKGTKTPISSGKASLSTERSGRGNSRKWKEEIPRCIPETLPASYTVEAAVIFPLMLSLMITGVFLMDLLVFQHRISEALDETAREAALYGEQLSGKGAEQGTAGGGIPLALLAERNISRKKADTKRVVGGRMGIVLTKAEVTTEEVLLEVSYQIRLPLLVPGVKPLSFRQTSGARRWVGWNPSMEEDPNGQRVYITPYGEAYHRERSCIHLNPRVRAVSKGDLKKLRSKSGQKYYPCPSCKKTKHGGYYVTPHGERYHRRRDCSAVGRTIRTTTETEARYLGYHSCGKCAFQ